MGADSTGCEDWSWILAKHPSNSAPISEGKLSPFYATPHWTQWNTGEVKRWLSGRLAFRVALESAECLSHWVSSIDWDNPRVQRLNFTKFQLAPLNSLLNKALTFGLPCSSLHCPLSAKILLGWFTRTLPYPWCFLLVISTHWPHPALWLEIPSSLYSGLSPISLPHYKTPL